VGSGQLHGAPEANVLALLTDLIGADSAVP
jgi:hypothetical protein